MANSKEKPTPFDVWGHHNGERFEAHAWVFQVIDGAELYRCPICGMRIEKADLKKQTDR